MYDYDNNRITTIEGYECLILFVAMRISKVNVEVNGKDTMVRMHRSSEKGALVYADIDQKDRTSEIIPEKKRASFNLSIENKTLVRYASVEKKDRAKYKTVENIIKNRKLPETIKVEDITPFLNHKFLQPVKYWQGDQLVTFNLSDCILRAVKQHDARELKPYDDWRKWYTEDKSEKLKKSIANNRIPITDEQSKRQKALAQWEPCFVEKGQLDLESYHQAFGTDVLAAKLGSMAKGELRDNGTPKETNEYHRNLKRTLQAHQALIFGTRETPNIDNRVDDQLAIYNLEIVKYLERYFPIKKSGRRNTADDIAHYLKADTIKRTVTHQLENAVRANLLRKGKYQHHELNETTTSETLSNLKRDEAFVMNLITTSAFAANNIRNIVDPQQTQDILGKKEFTASLAAERFNQHAFRLFFNVEDRVVDATTLWALRGAVQQIRNNVVHYKKEALATIFNVGGFEYPDSPDIAYSATIYKQLFEKELAKIPEAFALQLKSGGVLAYYDINLLKELLQTVTFQLCRSVVPFAPGFKKVMKSGVGYQNSEQDASFYDLELSGYKKKEEYSEEAWNGRYFLLKTIYNYLFLPEFTANAAKFADTVAWVLKKNKQQAQNSSNANAFAFADIRFMTQDESISDYMAYVQSQWMLEANKKKDKKNEDKKKEDVRLNFEKFVLQLFVKAFDNFLKQDKFKFIQMNPQPQINASDTNQQQADKLNLLEATILPFCKVHSRNIEPDKEAQIAWYVYCKLLDANHLSTLRNELIKYRSASGSDIFAHVTEIIELCLLSADQVPTDYRQIYPDKESCLQRLTPFMANGADYVKWGDLYVQTDKETPVVHSGIELSVKYGTANLLQKLIASDEKFKIAESDFDLWHPAKQTIELMIKQREKHHDLWREAKKKDDQEKKDKVKERGNHVSKFMKTKSADYMLICDYIDRYNQIDNKLHFDHLKRLQNLIVEILGRMAGFVVLFDRDFQYLDKQSKDNFRLNALVSLRELAKELATKPIADIDDIKNHDIVKKDGTEITEDDRDALIESIEKKRDFFQKLFFNPKIKPFEIRNHIAHFNYLTQSAEKKEKPSLIGLINALRDLLHYDRKLKNAVSEAFIDLFDKQGMVLKLKFDSQKHHLQIESVTPKPLFHLGTKKEEAGMYTDQVSQTYCDMCKCLLEMKN
jgi:hypothetical protein